MTPARSLAASVAALGFAGALTAPQPAFAAPAPCGRAENYAAQAGAELLRINKLEVRAPAAEQPRVKDRRNAESATPDAAERVLGTGGSPIPDPADSDTVSEGIGMLGDAVVGGLLPRSRRATPTNGVADVVPPPKGGGASTSAERHGSTATDQAATQGAGGQSTSGGTGGQGGGSFPTGPAPSGETDGPGGGSAAVPGVTGGSPATGSAPSNENGGQGGGAATPGVTGGQEDLGTPSAPAKGRPGGGTADEQATPTTAPGGGEQERAEGTGGQGGATIGENPAQPDDEDASGTAPARNGSGKPATAAIGDVAIGEARTAMIGNARVSSAAYARIINARSGGRAALAEPLLQQAPPTNAQAARRGTSSGRVGPVRLGKGSIGAHARWEPGMACGQTAGETGRADGAVIGVSVLGSLVRVPGQWKSLGTTALERHGAEARTVAEATVTAGRIELAGGAVQVRVLRAPTLTAGMSTSTGGEVRYRPAVVEVSGDGIATQRLDAAGEHADIDLRLDMHTAESTPLGRLADLTKAGPLPVPAIPGLPSIADTSQPESAPAAVPGTRIRVSLGDVRHAIKGHAIAAKATAIRVSLIRTAAPHGRSRQGYADARPTVAADLGFGLLEAAAVSPEKTASAPESAGAGGGLPVTGAPVAGMAMAGGALVLAGIAAVAFTARRRRTDG